MAATKAELMVGSKEIHWGLSWAQMTATKKADQKRSGSHWAELLANLKLMDSLKAENSEHLTPMASKKAAS